MLWSSSGDREFSSQCNPKISRVDQLLMSYTKKVFHLAHFSSSLKFGLTSGTSDLGLEESWAGLSKPNKLWNRVTWSKRLTVVSEDLIVLVKNSGSFRNSWMINIGIKMTVVGSTAQQLYGFSVKKVSKEPRTPPDRNSSKIWTVFLSRYNLHKNNQ